MKSFVYKMAEGLEFECKCPDEDYQWLKLLFERNSKPFKALIDMGFEIKEKSK